MSCICCAIKGLPIQKISHNFLWGGRLARPIGKADKMPAPQNGINYLLAVPNLPNPGIPLALLYGLSDDSAHLNPWLMLG